jgi:hypothetical protein
MLFVIGVLSAACGKQKRQPGMAGRLMMISHGQAGGQEAFAPGFLFVAFEFST